MKHNRMLTITSLLSILLLSLHVTDDIVRGISKPDFSNFGVVFYLAIMLLGPLFLANRLSGFVIMLLTGILALGMPFLHMRGTHYAEHAASPGGFFFVWTLFAVGVTGVLGIILSVRAMWRLRHRGDSLIS